jgi:hypothetical protein
MLKPELNQNRERSKPIAPDRAILIASVSFRLLPIKYSESLLIVIIVTGSKLRGFERKRGERMKANVPEIYCFTRARIQ